jgi:hypothetical protein
MAGLSLTQFSASWHVFVFCCGPAPFCHKRTASKGQSWSRSEVGLDWRFEVSPSAQLAKHFFLDMKINQFYSLFTNIQTFE